MHAAAAGPCQLRRTLCGTLMPPPPSNPASHNQFTHLDVLLLPTQLLLLLRLPLAVPPLHAAIGRSERSGGNLLPHTCLIHHGGR